MLHIPFTLNKKQLIREQVAKKWPDWLIHEIREIRPESWGSDKDAYFEVTLFQSADRKKTLDVYLE